MDDEEIEVNAVVEEEEVATEAQVDALKGDKGDTGSQGIQGEPGYTPVKGVDYFTEEDIDDILSDVNADIADLQTNKADKTEIPDVSSFITKEVNNLTNYTLKTATGSFIDLEINNTTYVITLSLKNVDGTVISTDTIDLPLESVVVSGRYDNATKKVILTLENGSEVDFSVADLVAGLQTEITSSNKLASDLVDDTNSGNKFTNTSEKTAWNAKYDKPSGGIPKTDLASEVQTSLVKADTALQEHQSLADYVKNTDYATGSKGGVIKIGSSYGTQVNASGILYPTKVEYSNYNNMSDYAFIGKGTLENVITGKQLINQTTLDDSQAEQDAEVEKLQAKVDLLESLIPTDTASGESLTLSNTARYPFKEFNAGGNTKQQSYTGNNLFNYLSTTGTTSSMAGITVKCNKDANKKIYTFTINGTGETTAQNAKSFNLLNIWQNTNYMNYISSASVLTLDEGTYTLAIRNKSGTITSEGTSSIRISIFSPATSAPHTQIATLGDVTTDNLDKVVTFTLSEQKKVYIGVQVQLKDGETDITYNNYSFKMQLVKGTYTAETLPDYEPYVGGQASPNPSYPQSVENVSGEVEVKVENKNLASISSKVDWRYSSTLENGDLKINGTSSDAGNILININGGNGLILKPNKTYILSVIMEGTVLGGQYKNIYLKGSSIGNLASNATIKHTITPTENYKLENINLDLAPNITFTNFTIKIQVEEGSIATSYEPHEEQIATFPLAEGQVLHETDTIEDKIVQRRKTVILDGSQPVNKFSAISALNTADYNCFLYNDSTIAKATNDSDINVISNKLIGTGSNKRTTNMANCWINHLVAGQLGMHIPNTVTNTTELLEYLTNNPITFEYNLAEPLEIPFTEAQRTAKAQIDKLYSYKGTTYISSSNKPSPVFEVVYRKSLE